MLYLLVGATGVGKITLAHAAAANIPQCKSYNLEHLVAQNAGMREARDVLKVHGVDGYWRHCAVVLQRIMRKHHDSPDIAICAIPRPALDSSRGRALIVKYPHSILIKDKAEDVYRRSGAWPNQPLAQFVAAEYNAYTRAVYDKLEEKGICFDRAGMDDPTAEREFLVWFKQRLRLRQAAKAKANY